MPHSVRLLLATAGANDRLANRIPTDSAFQHALDECYQAIFGRPASDKAGGFVDLVDAAAAAITRGCVREGGATRATSTETIAERLFGRSDAESADALRGLMFLRGIGDKSNELVGRTLKESTNSFRVHSFFRSLEGLFATPRAETTGVVFDGLTVERGTTYTFEQDE